MSLKQRDLEEPQQHIISYSWFASGLIFFLIGAQYRISTSQNTAQDLME